MGCKIKVTPLGVKDLEEIVPYMTQELDDADVAASFFDEVDVCYARMEESRSCLKNVMIPGLKPYNTAGLSSGTM